MIDQQFIGDVGVEHEQADNPDEFDRLHEPQVRCCGGKSLNDGVRAVCGLWVTHYPHRIDQAPGAL